MISVKRFSQAISAGRRPARQVRSPDFDNVFQVEKSCTFGATTCWIQLATTGWSRKVVRPHAISASLKLRLYKRRSKSPLLLSAPTFPPRICAAVRPLSSSRDTLKARAWQHHVSSSVDLHLSIMACNRVCNPNGLNTDGG